MNQMLKIKTHLIDISTPATIGGPWSEGFLVGCAFSEMITEQEFDELFSWIKEWHKPADGPTD